MVMFIQLTQKRWITSFQETKAIKVATSNGIDGLFTNDKYGNLVPAVAEDWSVSKDGLTYTYKIRKGVKWMTSDGEEYAEVTAKDFVNGLKHAADNKSAAKYLAEDSVKGLADYIAGNNKDFASVGVKAVDDYTLEYTLNKPEPYWNSKLAYSIFWPLNEEFENQKDLILVKRLTLHHCFTMDHSC